MSRRPGRAVTVCVAKDHVKPQLTGVIVTDPSDASATDAYDLGEGGWSAGMLGAAGVDVHLLPEIAFLTRYRGGADLSGRRPHRFGRGNAPPWNQVTFASIRCARTVLGEGVRWHQA